MAWTVVSKSPRADGTIDVLFEDAGVKHQVVGAPDLPDADLVAWWVAELVRVAEYKAARLEAIERVQGAV